MRCLIYHGMEIDIDIDTLLLSRDIVHDVINNDGIRHRGMMARGVKK